MSTQPEGYTQFSVTDDDLKRLRDTRLHFWIELVAARARQKLSDAFPNLCNSPDAAEHIKCERIANNALKHIQTLNIFFESGDTAERDYHKFMSGEPI